MKRSIFLNVMEDSQVKVHQCFGGKYFLHLQVKEQAEQATSKMQTQRSTCSFLGLLFDIEDGGGGSSETSVKICRAT
jgi:hypothetical protein